LQKHFAGREVTITAPIAHYKKGEFVNELDKLYTDGYSRFIIDGKIHAFKRVEEIYLLRLKKTERHTIDVIIDTVEVTQEEAARVQEGVERAFSLASGMCKIIVGEEEYRYAAARMCLRCAYSFPDLEPRLFSFNSPIGACKKCHGLGSHYQSYEDDDEEQGYQAVTCDKCQGKRLNEAALAVSIGGKSIYDLSELSIRDLRSFFDTLELDEEQTILSERLIQEVTSRLTFLCDVGLEYLALNRTARTLSGGEGQRIRLATQIGSALSGVLYILDEPSVGLHQRDNDRLIKTLHTLRDLGNTILVVEHDTDTMMNSDYIIDMGPAAGIFGGSVVAVGTPQEIIANEKSLTGAYLSGRKEIPPVTNVRTPKGYLTLKGCTTHNLQNVTARFPLGVLCGISGVSGSGKSTLIMEELVPQVTHALKRASTKVPVWMKEMFTDQDRLHGIDIIENLVVIDQAPIGRSSRSTPATYLGLFDEIRTIYASLPESAIRGYKVGRFSFNVPEGRCSHCAGDGSITVSMHFLADVTLICPTCKGTRYNAQTREILFKGKNIAEILTMTAGEAVDFFGAHPRLQKKLALLCEVGLDYVQLGQSSTTLSGGEAQRIKLACELAKRGTNTLYILDEPTTGLHTNDIEKLLKVLQSLVDKGNSLLIIEHNLDVLKTADYIIDMGPEGGDKGGQIVAQGSPYDIAREEKSHTGKYLKKVLHMAP